MFDPIEHVDYVTIIASSRIAFAEDVEDACRVAAALLLCS